MVCTVCGEDVEMEASFRVAAASLVRTAQPSLSLDRKTDKEDADRKLAELKARMRKEGKLKE